MLHRNLLQRVRDGTGEVLRVTGLPLQDDAERENRIRFFLEREFPHHDWNFKGAGDVMERNGRARREQLQFFGGMINESLDVGRIELARDNREMALPLCGAGASRCKRGHFSE